MITLYGIPNCGSVKRARAWLDAQGIAYQFHDFKKRGAPAAELPRWAAAVGWERLLNRQGTTWRRLDPAEQARADAMEGALALMQVQPSVIKRPVVDWGGGRITVGFDETRFTQALQSS